MHIAIKYIVHLMMEEEKEDVKDIISRGDDAFPKFFGEQHNCNVMRVLRYTRGRNQIISE